MKLFVNIFTEVIDRHLPRITKRVKRPTQHIKWITNEITKAAIAKRDNAKKNHDEKQYTFWRNKTTQLIREAKKNHYSQSIEIHRNNPKMLSSVFKELQNKKATGSQPINLHSRTKLSLVMVTLLMYLTSTLLV